MYVLNRDVERERKKTNKSYKNKVKNDDNWINCFLFLFTFVLLRNK